MEIIKVSTKSNFNSSRNGGTAKERVRRHRLGMEMEKGLKEMYPDILNFYTSPPSHSITLQEFEQFAVERLKMLRQIERKNSQSVTRYSNEYFNGLVSEFTKMKKELPTYSVMFSVRAEEEDKLYASKIDHIAHFLMRLAFVRSDEQRKWFISMEVDFFRMKLWYIHAIKPILEKYNLPFTEITDKERERFQHDISYSSFTMAGTHLDHQIFKAQFMHALDLVKNRKVFIYHGYCYIPFCDLAGVISVKFRSYLSESLSLLKQNIHNVDDDERLRPILTGFEKRYLGNDSSIVKSGTAVSVAELSGFSEKSFPLCMKHLYNVVNKDHHLKHWGRLQLGLFFKGLGLPMEEATKFWRNNFTKLPEIDSSRFDKQYLYNIRHMYGQEGKRADYTPYSCMKVIHSSVGPGDHHGCPFRHSDATPLKVKLVEAGIPQEGIKEIMKLVELEHFQIACQKYFEWTHDKHTVDGGVNHPNQYFMESRNVLTGKKTIKTEGKVEGIRSVVYKNGQSKKQSQAQAVEGSGERMDVTDGNTEDVDVLHMDDESDEVLASLAGMEY